VYSAGKGVDGKGKPPDSDEMADTVLMPYAERTQKDGRVREIQAHILSRLGGLVALGDLAAAEELPYLIQAVGRLRALGQERWPAALVTLTTILAGYEDLDRSTVLPLLLDAIAVLGRDGPTDARPLRAILADPKMFPKPRAAAARALGAMRDGGNADALQKIAKNTDNVATVRIAAIEGLGRLGAELRRDDPAFGDIARYLRTVLDNRAKERDTRLVIAAVSAFGHVADLPQLPILFELISALEHGEAAVAAVQRVMGRSESDCQDVARRYLVWRAEKGGALSAGPHAHPDDVLIGTLTWRPRDVTLGDAERILKVVARVLAEANDDSSPAIRRAAADLRALLKVPGAPQLDPEADAPARAVQVREWVKWWGEKEARIHLSGSNLIIRD
jgi:HEAT repeat protein